MEMEDVAAIPLERLENVLSMEKRFLAVLMAPWAHWKWVEMACSKCRKYLMECLAEYLAVNFISHVHA
jgi:hypothetical protein